MNARPVNDPPPALKIAIVIGLVTLVAGLASAIYLRWIQDDDGMAAPEVSVVRIQNMPADAQVQVTATWGEKGKTRTEDGHAGTVPGIWSFHLAPVRQSLTLTVWHIEGDARTVWLQRSVAFDRLEPVVLQLPKQ